jgi:hypothetical protein
LDSGRRLGEVAGPTSAQKVEASLGSREMSMTALSPQLAAPSAFFSRDLLAAEFAKFKRNIQVTAKYQDTAMFARYLQIGNLVRRFCAISEVLRSHLIFF